MCAEGFEFFAQGEDVVVNVIASGMSNNFIFESFKFSRQGSENLLIVDHDGLGQQIEQIVRAAILRLGVLADNPIARDLKEARGRFLYEDQKRRA